MSENIAQDISEKILPRQLCRICARQFDYANNLFTMVHCGLHLVDMLEACLQRSIQKENGLPSVICLECTANLIVAYDFNVLCNATEQQFREMFPLDYDVDCGTLVPKVEVIIDESEEDFSQGHFTTCIAMEIPTINVSNRNLSDTKWKNDRSAESSLFHKRGAEESKTKLKINKTRTSRSRPRIRNYECYRCKTSFSLMGSLRHHITTHYAHEKLLDCSECDKRFTDRKSLIKHVYKHRNRSCEYCTEKFDSLRKLKQHCLSTHNSQLTTYTCDLCLRKFLIKAQLLVHMYNHDTTTTKRHDCNVCTQQFLTEQQLKGHIRVAHTSFLCSECGKTFKNNSLLSSHHKLHKDEKPFVCTKCPSRFKWKVALTYHMTIHGTERKHVCETCGTSFTTRSAMRGHMRIHTGQRNFACSKCPKRFYRSTHLKRHDRTHTGEKPYKCRFCDRGFGQSAELNKHLRTHVGENTYQCDECPKNFRLNVDLKKHLYEHFQSKNAIDTINESKAKVEN